MRKGLQRVRDRQFKEADRLQDQVHQGEAFIQEVIREQQSLVDAAYRERETVNLRLTSLKKALTPYLETGERTDKYYALLEDYEQELQARRSLTEAINVAEESISQAQLGMLDEAGEL